MTDEYQIETGQTMIASRRRRNIVLGLLLAAASLTMYVSIFFRLSYNPLN